MKGFKIMNDRQLENKVRQDAEKVIKDINTLVGDSAARISKFEDNVSQATVKAKEDLTTWVEDGTSQLKDGIAKVTGDAKESVVDAAVTVKKDVGRGLSQYNAKAQDIARKIPGSFAKKVAKYPWVALSATLIVGFLLGILFRPVWRSFGQLQA
jgi:hypothetical protein